MVRLREAGREQRVSGLVFCGVFTVASIPNCDLREQVARNLRRGEVDREVGTAVAAAVAAEETSPNPRDPVVAIRDHTQRKRVHRCERLREGISPWNTISRLE